MNKMQWYEAAQKFNRMCESCGPNYRPALERYLVLLLKQSPLKFFESYGLIARGVHKAGIRKQCLYEVLPEGYCIADGEFTSTWRQIP